MSDDIVVKEYNNGSNWYKIYQSGIVEQGIKIYSATPIKDIKLPINYADTDYTVNVSNIPQYNPQKFYKSKQVLMTYTNITTTMKESVLPVFSYEVESESQFTVASDVSRARYEWFTKGYVKPLEYKTFSINPTPSDATIIINGIEQNNIQYPCGKCLTYIVKKDDYQTVTNTITITDDLTIDVNLEVELYSYTIKPTPSDAIVIINGIQQNTIIAQVGEIINWEINRIGYISQSGSDILTENMTKKVTLEALEFTFTINPTPSDAIVTLNNEERNIITVKYGTVVNWEVSLEDYSSQNGYLTVNEDTVLDIVLEESLDKFISNSHTTWYVNDNNLYGCGYNALGQQGNGTTNNVVEFTKRAENVKDLQSSTYTTWYLTNDGQLFGCGYNSDGQQGTGNTENVTTFTKRADNVKKVVCEQAQTWYIDNDNNLYGCGCNNNGNQGDGTTSHVLTWTKRASNVKEVVTGSNIATWYIDNDNNLYGCGDNEYGQQGNGSTNDVLTFTKRAENVKKVVTGYGYTTWYIDNDNKLYGCGQNTYGQMGTGNSSNITSFVKISENVKKVKSTNYASMYLTLDGELYGCGTNEHGLLGTGSTGDVVATFTKIAENVKDFEISNGVTVYLTNNNELYICGDNEYYQQSDGTQTDVTTFTKRAENVKKIFESSWQTFYLGNDNNLYGCGHNGHGQMGNGTTTYVTTFTKILEGLNI